MLQNRNIFVLKQDFLKHSFLKIVKFTSNRKTKYLHLEDEFILKTKSGRLTFVNIHCFKGGAEV